MNVLVIGNGFDIEHGLETEYRHFLNFTELFLQHAKENYENYDLGEEAEKLMVDYCTDNLLLRHFHEIRIGQGWVDFENEISLILQIIDDIFGSSSGNKFNVNKVEYASYKSVFCDYDKGHGVYRMERRDKRSLADRLLNDLKRIIYALEIYLAEVVAKQEIKKYSPTIASLKPRLILSFNYIDTYKKVYGREIIEPEDEALTYFIHGQAVSGREKEQNDMVLGVNEYLDMDSQDVDATFMRFKKFFQRLSNRMFYRHFTEFIMYEREKGKDLKDFTIHIFGHSLDVSDKEIFERLFHEPAERIIIYHHNHASKLQHIENLVQIIGREQLRIDMELGRIVFQKQEAATDNKYQLISNVS